MGPVAPGRCGVSVIYIVTAVLTAGLFVYLLYALFKPEKF